MILFKITAHCCFSVNKPTHLKHYERKEETKNSIYWTIHEVAFQVNRKKRETQTQIISPNGMDCFWMYWMLHSLCTFKYAHTFLSIFFLQYNDGWSRTNIGIFLLLLLLILMRWSLGHDRFWSIFEHLPNDLLRAQKNMPTALRFKRVIVDAPAVHYQHTQTNHYTYFPSSLLKNGLSYKTH